jgi:DNA-binding response OmpR family regulator
MIRSHVTKITKTEGGEQSRSLRRAGPLAIDATRSSVMKEGRTIALRPKEFEILDFLAKHPGRIFSKEELFTRVWGMDYLGDDNTIMVHIRRLRVKIEEDPSNPQLIETLWGRGYRLNIS